VTVDNASKYGGRTFQQVREHYEAEKEIADRLKTSKREERTAIFRTMYDELFTKVPHHPRLTRRNDPRLIDLANRSKMRLLDGHIDQSTVFLEFGPGDCRFAFEVCKIVKKVYAVDISNQIGDLKTIPENFELVIYDGYDLDRPTDSVDIIFSDDVIEHLHPADVDIHMRNAKRILRPSGKYIFRTPHRYSGPHDVSRYFSDEPEGLHLKEWTYREIHKLLKETGYSRFDVYRYRGESLVQVPKTIVFSLEYILRYLPRKMQRRLAWRFPLANIIIVVAEK
jgi:SAM-dependent methyltransferase